MHIQVSAFDRDLVRRRIVNADHWTNFRRGRRPTGVDRHRIGQRVGVVGAHGVGGRFYKLTAALSKQFLIIGSHRDRSRQRIQDRDVGQR